MNGIRRSMSAKFRSEFYYQEKEERPEIEVDDFVELPVFEVSESRLSDRALGRKMAQQEAKSFNIQEGGTLYQYKGKTIETDIGINFSELGSGWTFLNIRW